MGLPRLSKPSLYHPGPYQGLQVHKQIAGVRTAAGQPSPVVWLPASGRGNHAVAALNSPADKAAPPAHKCDIMDATNEATNAEGNVCEVGVGAGIATIRDRGIADKHGYGRLVAVRGNVGDTQQDHNAV